MYHGRLVVWALAVSGWAARPWVRTQGGRGAKVGADSKQSAGGIRQAGAEYAPAPLWVWNDLLTEDEVRSTLHDMADQKVMQVFVHPRPGLMTPYLSDAWFQMWKVALEEGKKLGMLVWIYDENSYPSGFAGGFVPELMPESRGRGLSVREVEQPR